MLISETFYTVQGEGTYIGVPSIFIRTSGCNLRCHFCDTPFTSWWTEHEKQDVDTIIRNIQSNWPDCRHVVISGGEPMMQKDLAELVKELRSLGKIVTIETNGTIERGNVVPNLFSISPKMSNSIPSDKKIFPTPPNPGTSTLDDYIRIHESGNVFPGMQDFVDCGIDYQIKMVIKDRNDIPEIQEFVKKYKIPNNKIFLMPEGITRKVQRERSLEIVEICKENNWVFCPRLHIELWGTKRGV